jgi:pimeloyl-ACP methyl ester carboxylesterase
MSAATSRLAAVFAAAAFFAAGAPGMTAAAAQERIIEAQGPVGLLQGSLLIPAPRADGKAPPVVLIIPGSGPTDRNGNNTYGIRAGTYRLLAEDLAGRGIASVRIDKRGLFASAAAVADPNAVTIPDYARDVHAWLEAIRSQTGAACVWVLGHSEGALVALAAAQDGSGSICRLVLVAGAGRPLGDVLRDQLRANAALAPLLPQALAAIANLEAGQRVDAGTLDPSLPPLFAPQVQGFLISAFSYDPAKLLAGYHGQALILQGGRDLQVSLADARRLAAAKANARLVLLPDVNHVLKAVATDDRATDIATYAEAANR